MNGARCPLPLNAWLRYDRVVVLLRDLPVRDVLEIGCGQGAMGMRLAARYNYLGVEPDATSHAVAARRMAHLGRGQLQHGTLEAIEPGRRFDLLCAFEVLEHLADDAATLVQWGSFLRPGGWLLVSVPAWQHRFGPHDERVGHYRRYDPASLRAVLEGAGFTDVEVQLYGFPLGYLLEWARDRMATRASMADSHEERTAGSGRLLQPPSWTGPVLQYSVLPFRLLQRPFIHGRLGTGLVARARSPQA